jgi:hypothetical protein
MPPMPDRLPPWCPTSSDRLRRETHRPPAKMFQNVRIADKKVGWIDKLDQVSKIVERWPEWIKRAAGFEADAEYDNTTKTQAMKVNMKDFAALF